MSYCEVWGATDASPEKNIHFRERVPCVALRNDACEVLLSQKENGSAWQWERDNTRKLAQRHGLVTNKEECDNATIPLDTGRMEFCDDLEEVSATQGAYTKRTSCFQVTSPVVPRWSPIQLLAEPDVA